MFSIVSSVMIIFGWCFSSMLIWCLGLMFCVCNCVDSVVICDVSVLKFSEMLL